MTGNDQDVLRKVGRGGAGNFYSAKDDGPAAAAITTDRVRLTDAHAMNRHRPELTSRQDLERQDPIVTTIQDPAAAGQPVRAGRGGAGNYIDPSQLPHTDDKNRIANEVAAAVTSSLKKHPHRAMGGRGGAGNWTGEEQEPRKEDEAGSTTEQLERKVKEAVERGLKIPEKVHHGREKEMR
ncbi:hypothetical protein NOR_06547 [Metarhizium rileyi]|uniref:Uncharacterized protein n=1 Tax=Metarhizium rileyi (strain RCEF 4871) TaxID=1649241 RepID=A0A167AGM4_METRR|nr:hypothetical protein NOR_06547 [Metarhizium rileyi RCEF 4871]TWU77370.1 hypothetical protein ED733_005836 [Metarhizium rileyi]